MLEQRYWELAGRLMGILAQQIDDRQFDLQLQWERAIAGGGFMFFISPRARGWSGAVFGDWADAERLNGDLEQLAGEWIEKIREIYKPILGA